MVLEKEVSAKRQKKDSEKVVPKEDIKKVKKALKDVPAITKPEISSSEDDSSSDSEEEVCNCYFVYFLLIQNLADLPQYTAPLLVIVFFSFV